MIWGHDDRDRPSRRCWSAHATGDRVGVRRPSGANSSRRCCATCASSPGDAAEDVASETWATVATSISSLRRRREPPSAAWLFTVARRRGDRPLPTRGAPTVGARSTPSCSARTPVAASGAGPRRRRARARSPLESALDLIAELPTATGVRPSMLRAIAGLDVRPRRRDHGQAPGHRPGARPPRPPHPRPPTLGGGARRNAVIGGVRSRSRCSVTGSDPRARRSTRSTAERLLRGAPDRRSARRLPAARSAARGRVGAPASADELARLGCRGGCVRRRAPRRQRAAPTDPDHGRVGAHGARRWPPSTGTAVAATQGALPEPVQQVAHEALGVGRHLACPGSPKRRPATAAATGVGRQRDEPARPRPPARRPPPPQPTGAGACRRTTDATTGTTRDRSDDTASNGNAHGRQGGDGTARTPTAGPGNNSGDGNPGPARRRGTTGRTPVAAPVETAVEQPARPEQRQGQRPAAGAAGPGEEVVLSCRLHLSR